MFKYTLLADDGWDMGKTNIIYHLLPGKWMASRNLWRAPRSLRTEPQPRQRQGQTPAFSFFPEAGWDLARKTQLCISNAEPVPF